MTRVLFELDAVSKRYGEMESTSVLNNVTVTGYAGELLLVLGPSGSGKTTLLLIAGGFLVPTMGGVRLFGKLLRDYSANDLRSLRATQIGFVFQNHHLLEALSVYDNVALACSFSERTNADCKVAVMHALRSAGIEHRINSTSGDLSQGERQRVAIARSIVNRPPLLIADEPTASLESKRALEVFSFYRSYATERKACVIVASHDERLIPFADRIFRLNDGSLFAPDSVVSDSTPPTNPSSF